MKPLTKDQYQFIKDNIAVTEQQETQRLMNQASATLQSEQAVPAEEQLLTPQNK
jgi:hypothetical protein